MEKVKKNKVPNGKKKLMTRWYISNIYNPLNYLKTNYIIGSNRTNKRAN